MHGKGSRRGQTFTNSSPQFVHAYPQPRRSLAERQPPSSYQISVMDFVYDRDDEGAIGRYAMRKENGHGLSGLLNVIFIELSKVAAKEKAISDNTPIENWAIFLKEVDNPAKRDTTRRITEKEEGLMAAITSLDAQSPSAISMDMERRIWQCRQEDYERNQISGITAAEQRGITRTKIENARNLIAMKVLSHEQITQAVRLPVDKVKRMAEG